MDLELDSDLAKLSDAEAYLRRFTNKLLIIDEVQRQPNLFRLFESSQFDITINKITLNI